MPFESAGRGTSVQACYSQDRADNPLPQPVRSLQRTYSCLKSWHFCAFKFVKELLINSDVFSVHEYFGKVYTISLTSLIARMSPFLSFCKFSNVLLQASFKGHAGNGARKFDLYG